MKITVEFDTVTKVGSVSRDGEAVDNLECFCLYPMYYENDDKNKFSMELRQYKDSTKEDGTRQYTSTMASIGQVLLGKNEN